MEEEKFSPNFGKMELTEIEGTAKTSKNTADRRFKKFVGDIQEVIDAGMYKKKLPAGQGPQKGRG